MKIPLKVLIIEDSEDDTLLLLRELEKNGYVPVSQRVETAEALRAALQEKTWDIILSDYHLPRFSGLQALLLFKESGMDIPFILVSGMIGEELAVEAMKTGAHDYIMKGNLARLVPAIERELREVDPGKQILALGREVTLGLHVVEMAEEEVLPGALHVGELIAQDDFVHTGERGR